MASAWDSFWHPDKAYNKAGDTLNQYYKTAQDSLQPYINNGATAGNRLNEQADELNDPAALQAKWAAGYSESPYAQQLTKQATASGQNAASSAGLLGSSAALNNVQTSASNIMQSDRQQYLDSLMQKYMASIGIGQNLYGVGATAGNQASSNALNQGQNQAGLTYGANAAPGAMFGKLAGAGADLGINWATGGASGLAKAATNMFGGNS
jgi:hypothetical protein